MRAIHASNPNISAMWTHILPNPVAYSVSLAYGEGLPAISRLSIQTLKSWGWQETRVTVQLTPMDVIMARCSAHPEEWIVNVPIEVAKERALDGLTQNDAREIEKFRNFLNDPDVKDDPQAVYKKHYGEPS